MQLTAVGTPKESEYLETRLLSQERPAYDTHVDISQTNNIEEQQTIEELDGLLKPALNELDNREISHKTFKEIVNETLDKIFGKNK